MILKQNTIFYTITWSSEKCAEMLATVFLKSSCYIDVTFIGRQAHKKGNDTWKITLYIRLLPSHHLQCHRGRCRSSFHHHENDDHHTLIFSSYYDHYHHDPRQHRSSKHNPAHVFTRRKITQNVEFLLACRSVESWHEEFLRS